ncbi:MAG: SDR family oxidoreductase [Granulosicoccus sp.]|nr:SDR family oxidoreductase [Granulosicoccus sp.]
MDLGLDNKNALVCAASKGIGLACAQALAAEGVHVHLVARNSHTLEQAVHLITQSGGTASPIVADLTHADAATTILAALPEADIVVTNPGLSPAADLLDGQKAWESGITDIVGRPFALINQYLPYMKSQQFGRIINITSSAVLMSHPGLAFSGALRAALTHATTSLAQRVAPHGITVNNLAPGPVATDGLMDFFKRYATESGRTVEEVKAERLASIPTKRFVSVDELGKQCAYIASVHTNNLTGKTLLIDGGINTYPFL